MFVKMKLASYFRRLECYIIDRRIPSLQRILPAGPLRYDVEPRPLAVAL